MKANISKHSSDAAAAIRARKLSIKAMLETLRMRVENTPEDGNWGHAGDLGYIEEQLFQLVDR